MALGHIKNIRSIQQKLTRMKPHEKWVLVRDFVTIIYRLSLCPITDLKFKRKWSTWICFLVYMEVNVLIIYMLYINRQDFLNSALNLYTCGCEFGVSVEAEQISIRFAHLNRYVCFFHSRVSFTTCISLDQLDLDIKI